MSESFDRLAYRYVYDVPERGDETVRSKGVLFFTDPSELVRFDIGNTEFLWDDLSFDEEIGLEKMRRVNGEDPRYMNRLEWHYKRNWDDFRKASYPVRQGDHNLGYFLPMDTLEVPVLSSFVDDQFPCSSEFLGVRPDLERSAPELASLAKHHLYRLAWKQRSRSPKWGSYIVMMPQERQGMLESLARRVHDGQFSDVEESVDMAVSVFQGSGVEDEVAEMVRRTGEGDLEGGELRSYIDKVNSAVSMIIQERYESAVQMLSEL